MKKFIILIIAAALSLCSCGEAGGGVGYDCNNNFSQYNAVRICENGGALFFLPDISEMIWYYDESADVAGLLCGKPECSHSGKDCNAYFNGRELSFYGGRLYGLDIFSASDCKIISSAPDGSGRKTELDLAGSEFSEMLSDSVANLRGMFHRGYFYSCGTHNTVSDGILRSTAQVFAYSLDGGGGKIYENAELTDIEIFPRGDFLYFIASGGGRLELCRYSPADGGLETLYSGETDVESPKLWVKITPDGEEIYIGDRGESAEVYRLDPAKGSLVPQIRLDAPYLVYGFSDGFVVGGSMVGAEFMLRLTDYGGETLLEASFMPPGIADGEPFFTFPCGSDGENVYLWSKVWSAEHDVQFLSAISLKSGKSRVLWTNDGGGEDET